MFESHIPVDRMSEITHICYTCLRIASETTSNYDFYLIPMGCPRSNHHHPHLKATRILVSSIPRPTLFDTGLRPDVVLVSAAETREMIFEPQVCNFRFPPPRLLVCSGHN